uniref:Uncharacterized protein n=1 Tax=Arundo donax TaxID=35708 RepID=A0A0A9G6R2_ARUDO
MNDAMGERVNGNYY